MATKTAISIDETLFAKVDALAKELEVSRSYLFSVATEEYIERYENRRMLAELNAVYDGSPVDEEDSKLLQGYTALRRRNAEADGEDW